MTELEQMKDKYLKILEELSTIIIDEREKNAKLEENLIQEENENENKIKELENIIHENENKIKELKNIIQENKILLKKYTDDNNQLVMKKYIEHDELYEYLKTINELIKSIN